MGAGMFRQIALLSVSERPRTVTAHRSNADVRLSDAAVEVIHALADEIRTLTVQ
jgi:hypothetical protein